MSVFKRKWTTPAGVPKEAWAADYVDASGSRRRKHFERKKDAEAYLLTVKGEMREGVHTPASVSQTVAQAGEEWIASAKASGLERTTVESYRLHLDRHIVPLLGARKLSELSVPMVREFEDRQRERGLSAAMVRKVRTSLGSLLADAQERGRVARNVVREMRAKRHRGTEMRRDRRQKGKLKVGVDIPTVSEARAIVAAVSGRWRPLIVTAIFAGLRASELRGLRWSDVDIDRREIHVRQRADRYNDIGQPKSEAGERTIPVGPLVVNTLREWKLACPRRETGEVDATGEPVKALHFVFPNGVGKVEQLNNIVRRGLQPVQIECGVTINTGKVDEQGRAIVRAKYTGMHALRHFYASWCINRREDGGQGLPAKVVQERLGHSSIVMTMDVYGHLFPRGDDADELATAENAFLRAT
jgi:integrase